jgi:prephenate dehydratase
MSNRQRLSKAEEKDLIAAYRTLSEFSKHEIPVVRFNSRKAKNEIWQALFELDLIAPESREERK